MERQRILQEVSTAFGVSGHEEPVRDVILGLVKDLVDGYHVDALGNLIAWKKGTGQHRRRVMVAAHMDEVGLMVAHIEKRGILRFRAVGGISQRVLLAKKVLVGDKRVPGVIGMKPIHLLEPEARKKTVSIEEMYIDIGVSSEEVAGNLVQRGDYVSFDVPFAELGGALKTVKGKAFDDRAGCTVLIELLRDRYPDDLFAVFSTQEEVGSRGARVAAYTIRPDMGFALEGTVCYDLPTKRNISPGTRIGHGPAITIMDQSVISDRRLVQHLFDTAAANTIPYQVKQPAIGATDAGMISLSGAGVPAVTVAVPTRFIHSPVALLSMTDVEHTFTLMRHALADLTQVQLD